MSGPVFNWQGYGSDLALQTVTWDPSPIVWIQDRDAGGPKLADISRDYGHTVIEGGFRDQ